MISDETYNNRLTDAKAALSAWAERNAAGARIIIDQGDLYWRIFAEPVELSICPIELIFREDRNYDMAIADASVEDQPIVDFDMFLPVFDSVAQGSVITRSYLTRTTRQLLAKRTIVPLVSYDDWDVWNKTALGERIGLTDCLIKDRRYARYAR